MDLNKRDKFLIETVIAEITEYLEKFDSQDKSGGYVSNYTLDDWETRLKWALLGTSGKGS